LVIDGDVIEQRLQQAVTLSEENAWGVEQFRAWFHEAFLSRAAAQEIAVEGAAAGAVAANRDGEPAVAFQVPNMGTAAAAVDIFSDGISTAAEAVTDSVKRLAGAEDDGDDEEDAQTILRRLSIELGEVSEELDFTDIANKPNRDEEPFLYYRWIVANTVESSNFQIAVTVAILSNALMLGVQVDYPGQGWIYPDSFFAFLFTFEIAARIFGRGRHFFLDLFALFDLTVVIISLVEISVVYAGASGTTSKYGCLRILRIFRIIRTMRVFERMTALLDAFGIAFQDVMWVSLLGIVALYTSALVAKDIISEKTLRDNGYTEPGYFGSVPKTMMTLLGVMTFDGWYTAMAAPINEITNGAFVYFLIFAVICGLGILNLVTAIFIDSVANVQQKGVLKRMRQDELQRKYLVKLMQEVFEQNDKDGTGDLDKKEMQLALKSFERPSYQTVFNTLGIDLSMVESMLKHADSDLDGKVNVEEFTEKVEKMQEGVQKYELWALDAILMKTNRHLDRLTDTAQKKDTILATTSELLGQQLHEASLLNSRMIELNRKLGMH